MENNNTIEIEELKPCPFCGSPAMVGITEYGYYKGTCYYIRCANEHCKLSTIYSKAIERPNDGVMYDKKPEEYVPALTAIKQVATIWNNRVDDDGNAADDTSVTREKLADKFSDIIRRFLHG